MAPPTPVLDNSPKREIGSVLIGTADWGQRVEKDEAFRILKCFYERGYFWLDVATNYPIDGIPEHFGQTLTWLSDFRSDLPELKILVKIGGASNQGDSSSLLGASYFELMFSRLAGELGDSLGGLSIHWDDGRMNFDRGPTIGFLGKIREFGYEVGLSGISNVEKYEKHSLSKSLPWIYQINASPVGFQQLTANILRIKESFPQSKVYGYNILGGISRKGLTAGVERKIELQKLINFKTVDDDIKVLDSIVNQAFAHGVSGIVIGPKNETQSLDWCRTLERLSLV